MKTTWKGVCRASYQFSVFQCNVARADCGATADALVDVACAELAAGRAHGLPGCDPAVAAARRRAVGVLTHVVVLC